MKPKKRQPLIIARRFDASRVVLGITVGSLCKELETSRHIYKNIMSGRTPLPADWVDYMELTYRISYAWVLGGHGDMFLPQRRTA